MAGESILKKLQFNQFKSSVIVEFVGTFLFVLTIPLASITSPEVTALAVGFMLMSMVFCFGYISGAHYNPAVSFAVFLAQPEFGLGKLILYVIAQIAGAACAAFYCVLIHGPEFPVPNTNNDPVRIARAFVAEFVFTFVLASVVLHVACSKQKDNNFYGFAIGMAVLSAALCVGGISGGAFNPAVATGLIVVRCFTLYCMPVVQLWMYWGSEILAAFCAALLYTAVRDAK